MVYSPLICAPALLALTVLVSCKDDAPTGAMADQASVADDQQVLPADQGARLRDHAPDSALARKLTDQPDDVSGAQIHAMYVLPVDGVDRSLDTNGVIAASVAAFNGWLAAQTSGRSLRLDTHKGALDVSFFRLKATEAQLRAKGAFVRDAIEQELTTAGRIKPGKLYAVYFDGPSTWACGGGAWPPKLKGRVAALYLRGTPPGAPPCAGNSLVGTAASPGYVAFSMLHELLHTMGFVAACGLNHVLDGHTSDDPADLMYAGSQPWKPSKLDVGRDDYFGHGKAGCLDLDESAYLSATKP